jgi:ferrous iron transport protein B
MSDCHAGGTVTLAPETPSSRSHLVALIGPPNSGKSTLFNQLTGLRQKVANFPGVTVEHHIGKAKLNGRREVLLVDLPGVYSFNARTEDERVALDALQGGQPGLDKPEAVLLILDSTNLGRHLVLAAQVLALELPTLVILNMADDLEARGGKIDIGALSRELGAPVVLASAARGVGIEPVREFLAQHSRTAEVPKLPPVLQPALTSVPACRKWSAEVTQKAGYRSPAPPEWSRKLDRVFLHPWLGPLIFGLVVVLVFQSIFTWAQPAMDWIEQAIVDSGAWIGTQLPESLFRSLLVDGIWSGVGSVVVFLPQILLLFLFIGVLEDSGYLARAAVIADRTMARVGLQGKSFIPLLSAYACAVPAIMAARTIENKRDRLATVLIAPFMTCSARLPVYTLLIAAFIPDRPLAGGFLGTRAAAMLGLYAVGFFAAVVTAKLLKSTVLRSGPSTFLLEMPPYRWPTLRSLAFRLLDRAKVFLKRAGTVILGVAVLLWVLASVPMTDGKPPVIADSIIGQIGHAIEPVIQPLGFNWKIGIGLITSLAAREVIVGTLGTIYGIEGTAQSDGLQKALQQDLSFAGAMALLVFFAFAMQCMSTVAIVRREAGGWRWAAAQFAYMTAWAYAGAWITYTLLS